MKLIVKSVKRMLYVIAAIVLLCCLLLLICSINRNKAKFEALRCFQENRALFEQTLDKADTESNTVTNFFNFSGIVQMDIPDELLNCGMYEIFSADGNTYFEFGSRMIGTVPHGILYIINKDKVDQWYKLEEIEENWYYYRVPS